MPELHRTIYSEQEGTIPAAISGLKNLSILPLDEWSNQRYPIAEQNLFTT
jgi:hypothetical protein